MARLHDNQLAVEATDDQGAVIGLLGHHIEWGKTKDDWPVLIITAGSSGELLDRTFLQTNLKASGLKRFGIVVDADDKFESRWASIQGFCKAQGFKNIPKNIDKAGLILSRDDGMRFGAWIMPDNASHGMLETFCKALVPDGNDKLWAHAEASFAKAVELGAPCKKAHYEKANIHTWLAWQDPPGERMGTALTRNILNPKSALAEPFVDWFLGLYELKRK